jgi:hypothetical protein
VHEHHLLAGPNEKMPTKIGTQQAAYPKAGVFFVGAQVADLLCQQSRIWNRQHPQMRGRYLIKGSARSAIALAW